MLILVQHIRDGAVTDLQRPCRCPRIAVFFNRIEEQLALRRRTRLKEFCLVNLARCFNMFQYQLRLFTALPAQHNALGR